MILILMMMMMKMIIMVILIKITTKIDKDYLDIQIQFLNLKQILYQPRINYIQKHSIIKAGQL